MRSFVLFRSRLSVVQSEHPDSFVVADLLYSTAYASAGLYYYNRPIQTQIFNLQELLLFLPAIAAIIA